MYRSSSNRIVPVIIIIIIIVALIAGMVAVGRMLFGSRDDRSQAALQQQAARDALLTINANQSIRMTLRGPIVADETFTTKRISISPNTRTFTEYNGYLDSVKSTRSYNNNTAAYEEFVYALDKAALTQPGKQTTEEASDLRGICATGQLYEFEILSGSQVTYKYWTSTCKGSPGTFGASVTQVKNLFDKQIPTEKQQSQLPSLNDL